MPSSCSIPARLLPKATRICCAHRRSNGRLQNAMLPFIMLLLLWQQPSCQPVPPLLPGHTVQRGAKDAAHAVDDAAKDTAHAAKVQHCMCAHRPATAHHLLCCGTGGEVHGVCEALWSVHCLGACAVHGDRLASLNTPQSCPCNPTHALTANPLPHPISLQSTIKDAKYATEDAAKDTGHGIKVGCLDCIVAGQSRRTTCMAHSRLA